ncbi:UDP-N-acetylglucosamine 2-epimerase [Aestuariispira insulae]|uniref:UDP-N-acetylglucosamine 2-epimerase (Non-hydrolysing)/GDP/UDP-N,N'-diacetylbacillosamine 2-epimerase (Hydrolysing) n=1 Tax=Aestuariispira insulae TaxID=1461337 RepID=A0A3D9HX83_9PROT|nr:UDP-N-acetylglucosamine 2-epimerase [Aestuariispira insulae]RED54104.1 UDP-N-acetylglucosamine 2-epimerase (non-hydrolysing)/GDP/UDP-N,N'-diacetylbacillosamine 2-epimerase (hydrolysing) [Aestuariispira insulae]
MSERVVGPRRILVVTGSRADYGLLHWPMRLLQDHPAFHLQVAVTGMHLSDAHDETWKIIEQDGFPVDARIEMLIPGKDSPTDICQAMALGIAGFSQALPQLDPDLVVVLGDRFEIFAAATAASMCGFPIAHLCGGDLTLGAIDDAMRHAITKLSHLHFPSNDEAADRLMRMGEQPDRIHMIGSPGLDQIRHMAFKPRDEVFQAIGLAPGKKNLMVTLHPATLEQGDPLGQAQNLLEALDHFGQDLSIVLTGSNADTGGQAISGRFSHYADERPNAAFRANLGTDLYLNLLNQVDMVVGNSSSGLYEVPSFGIATVNIGSRQDGRLKAASVIDCGSLAEEVVAAMEKGFQADFSDVKNPYGDGCSSVRFVDRLTQVEDFTALMAKQFYEGPLDE